MDTLQESHILIRVETGDRMSRAPGIGPGRYALQLAVSAR